MKNKFSLNPIGRIIQLIKKCYLDSIYVLFAIIFLGIWWLMTFLNFSVIRILLSNTIMTKLQNENPEFINEFHKVGHSIGLIFLVSAIIGTILILIAVSRIVKPIKGLSKTAKAVAKGNFDITVKTKMRNELGQLIEDFNLMAKELKNIDFLRQDFVSNVSHEFKTPITSIKGFAMLIRSGELSNNQLVEYSDIIINESERLSLLSSNLLKLSELDSKVIYEQWKLFSLDEQLRKTILILEIEWSKKEIEFDIELEETTIMGDEHLLQEVWLNLIQNAIKFSSQKGIIKISLCKNGNMAKIMICDTGIGISEEDKKRIFERFYKGDKSRSKDGNGLGLVIVKKIVELSNGRIYFESELSKGSTFIVELPV